MTRSIALGALLLVLTAQAGLAIDPDEAGRQGRSELIALMDKQRSDRQQSSPAAIERTAADTVPAPPSKRDDRRAQRTVDSRVPTICRGC